MKHLLRFKTFLLLAIFSLLAGTSAWAQSDFSSTETSNVTLIKGTNASDCTVNGKDGIKVGTSSKGGDMSVTVPAGTKYLHLHAAAWKGVNSLSLNISEATVSPASISLSPDAGVSNNSPFTLSGDASDFYFVIELSNITTETTLKFTTSTTKRFVIWGVNAEEESGTGGDTSVATTVTIDASGIKNTDVYAGTDAGSLTATVSTDEGAISGAIVTWSGNNDAVATIDASTGAVTLVAAGSVTFTASYAGVEDTYKPSSKTYVMTVTNNDPTIPGTENNPYTVAQARAAIDAGSGTQGVYATGIVSEIITAYGYNNYSNITFNIVTQDGDSEFLQAFRCVSSTNADASTIAVGDIVVVSGNLTKYNTTYEFAQGCQVVSITHPVVAVATPTFDPVAGAYSEPQNVTISCATDGADIYYTTDGTEPDANSTPFTGAINVATTTTIKAIAYKGGESSAVAKGTYHITSVDNPYTVSQALGFDDSEYPIEQIYVHGIVSTAPTQAPTNYGQLTYYISDDGTTTNQLQVYKGQGLNAVEFTSQDDIQVGDEVTIIGNVKIYNNAKEFDTGNYLVAFNRPVVATPSITITPDTYEMDAKAGGGVLPVVCENLASDPELAVVFVEADGTTPATYDWIQATINANGNIDGQITANDTGAARTAYFKVSGKAADGSTVYSNLVTFTQQAAATEPYITVNTGAWDVDANGGSKMFGFDYENLGSNPTFEVKFFESDGDTETGCGWIMYQFDSNDNKVTITASNNNENSARTAYFKVCAEVNKTTIYSNLVTVNQAAPAVPVTGDYVKVTTDADLTDGEYLIVYEDGAVAFNGSLDVLDASSNTVAVTIDNNTIASTTAVDAATFTIDATAGTIQSASGYYIGQTSDANGLKASNTEAYTNTMSIDADGNAVILASGGAYLRYNATSGQERFRYFKSSTYSSQKAIALYKKSSSPAPTTPSITLPAGYQFEVNADGGDNELPVTCSNLATDPQLAVVFCESDGTIPATYDHTWITAVINSNGNIDGHIDENTGTQRTAYFKVTGKDANDNDVYSDLVTITQAAPAAASIEFNKTSLDIVAGGENRTVSFEYHNLGSNPTLQVQFFEVDEVTATTCDWVTPTFSQEDGKLDLAIAANTGAARSAYLKIYAVEKDVYSNLFTVNQAEVNASTTPSITLPGGYDYTMDAKAGGGELPVTCSNMPADPQLEVLFYESDGTTSATYDWISATINANGNIDGQIQENTGAARTAYFKVHGVDADKNDVYSNLVTFTQEAPVAATPTIVFNPNSIDFDANSGSKTIGGDYFQLKDFDSTPSLEILYYESDGETSATYDWFTANVNTEGKIELVYNDNTGAARSAYLKIHAVGTTVYSNLFTVNQAAYVNPNAEHYYQKVTADADLTDGQYLIVYEDGSVAFDGGLSTLDATSNTIDVTIVGDKIEGNSTTDAATFTIDVTAGTLQSASGLYIGQTSDANGLKAEGATAYQNTLSIDADGNADVVSSGGAYLRYNATSGQDRFRYFKSSTYTAQKAIQLYKRVEGAIPGYVATPTFDPAAGEVQAGTLVTISTTTANATIRYTTDGSEPTTSNGEEYQKPIVINSDVTIKAIAVDDNQNVSAVAEATYTIATSSQLSPELTLDPKSLNVTEGAANGTVTVTTAAGYNGTITVMVDDPSVADASYDAGVITVVYGHAGSAVISVTAGADGDYVEQMEQISVNVSAPVQPAQAAVVVWSEDWSSFDLNDSETPAANGDFTYVYTNGDNATKLYDDVLAGGTSPELLINKNGGAFSATIPLYGAYGNMTLTFKTNNKLSEVRAKVDDDTNNDITLDPANVNGKNVYTLPFTVAEGANQVVLTFTNTSSKNLRIDDFQLTAPQVAVNISSVGYATMYYGSSNLVVPAGVTASTYWVDGDLLKVSQEYTEGAVLAKAQGYILTGAPGSYTFTATNDAANEDPKNLLCGSDVAVTTTAPVAGNFLFYLLGVDNGKVGFYWGKDNGAAFTSGAHKAYLAVPENAANGIRAFYFDDVFTGVDNLNLNVENENAYDMQGRRVQQLQKGGLYIINGKKMLAK